MKNGFTLIELLGVIVILGLILVVAMPSLIESNKNAAINEQEDFENTIKIATKDYINSCANIDYCLNKHSDAFENLFSTNMTINIQAKELVDSGFLKENFKNPKTNKTVNEESKTITITNNSGNLTITYNG